MGERTTWMHEHHSSGKASTTSPRYPPFVHLDHVRLEFEAGVRLLPLPRNHLGRLLVVPQIAIRYDCTLCLASLHVSVCAPHVSEHTRGAPRRRKAVAAALVVVAKLAAVLAVGDQPHRLHTTRHTRDTSIVLARLARKAERRQLWQVVCRRGSARGSMSGERGGCGCGAGCMFMTPCRGDGEGMMRGSIEGWGGWDGTDGGSRMRWLLSTQL